MGIINTIRKTFLGEDEPPQQKALNQEYAYNGYGFIPIDGVGGYTSLNGSNTAYEKISVVYKIVNHIAGRVAEAVIEQKERKKDGDQMEETPFLQKIEEPNPFQNKSDFLSEISMYLDLKGEFYIWVEPKTIQSKLDQDTKFLNLWCLPPNLITASRSANGVVQSYSYRGGIIIPADQIYHYRKAVPGFRADENVNTALSPLAVAYPEIKVLDYANATSQKTLGNGAVPGVAYVKQKDGNVALDGTAIKDLKDFLVKRYTARETYGEVPLVGEEIGFTPFGINPRDAMIIETVQMNKEGIANAFSYPLPLLHNKTGGLNSSERQDAMKELLTSVVFPRLETICGVLTKILNDKLYRITFDKYSYPEMEADWQTLSKSLEAMPFLSWNEKRKILMFEPIENVVFDLPFIPNNIVTLDEFLAGGTSVEDELPNDGDFV